MAAKDVPHTKECDAGKAQVGQCWRCAEDSVVAIFEALPKKRQGDMIGNYNEALCFIVAHKPA